MRDEIKIKVLSKDDLVSFRELITLFQEVFDHSDDDLPTNGYLTELLLKSDFVVLVAIYDQQIVGGLTAYEIRKYHKEATELFIYDIAVKREFQRKGIGKALLSKLKSLSSERGIDEMFVAAHADDVQALQFYKGTGGEQEKVVHFNYYN